MVVFRGRPDGPNDLRLLSLRDLLDNRKQKIWKTIRNSEELQENAIEQLEKAQARLRKVETEADLFRVNGYSEIKREKLNLINSIYTTLEQLENYKNEAIDFEQQRVINQVRQRVLQQALQRSKNSEREKEEKPEFQKFRFEEEEEDFMQTVPPRGFHQNVRLLLARHLDPTDRRSSFFSLPPDASRGLSRILFVIGNSQKLVQGEARVSCVDSRSGSLRVGKEKLAFRVSKVGAVLFELVECLLPVRVSKEALPVRLSKEVTLCTLPVRLSKEESFDSNQYKNHLCDFSLPYTP
ncbi:hypothetical protein V8G54_008871 [Vigna mungo]|uniref:Uncharacterized protein n=1 Tax=Vigna mungo TaxID=3915 RepID=A0AAQ3S6W6_VIGMU